MGSIFLEANVTSFKWQSIFINLIVHVIWVTGSNIPKISQNLEIQILKKLQYLTSNGIKEYKKS